MVRRKKLAVTIKMGMVMSFWIFFITQKSALDVHPGSKWLLMKILLKVFSKWHLDGNTDG